MAGTTRAPVVVDVRDDLRGGRHPLARILQAVKALASGQGLLLLTTFEPVPLYRVLAVRGFDHEARQLPDGDWEVRFVKRPRRGAGRVPEPLPATVPHSPPASDRSQPAPSSGEPPPEAQVRWTRLDNRGLEPPEPMICTFTALGTLAEGQVLEIHNDRRPMFLYPHLEARGYRYQTQDEDDGSALVRIWKASAGCGEVVSNRGL